MQSPTLRPTSAAQQSWQSGSVVHTGCPGREQGQPHVGRPPSRLRVAVTSPTQQAEAAALRSWRWAPSSCLTTARTPPLAHPFYYCITVAPTSVKPRARSKYSTARACFGRAHQFTQNALLESPQARTQVPLGWTRASEYPTLVAPWLHGEPHQSREECLAAFAGTGKPPKRWPHVYTGNVAAQGAAMFRPALPALPAVPATALARVLTGIDKFDTAPCATAWLLHELPGRGRQIDE